MRYGDERDKREPKSMTTLVTWHLRGTLGSIRKFLRCFIMSFLNLLFVTTATTGDGVLFSSRCIFSQKERRRDCFSKVYSYTIPDKKCHKYSIPMSKTSITPTKIPSTPTKIPSTPTKIPSTPTENLRCFVARKFLSQIW